MEQIAALLILLGSHAQAAPPPPRPAAISGVVVSDLSGSPLRRARVTLLPRATGLENPTVETDENGVFSIQNVTPGPYGLQATRDGFLASSTPRTSQFRLPRVVRIMPGDDLKDVTFRLQPWAVIDGTVRFFDDRDPAMNVPVFAYQKVYLRGQKTYAAVARTRTDDRGYYRLPGLPPGAYILAAVYNKPVAKPAKDEPLDLNKVPEREPSYSSVFFPNGDRIGDALPVQVYAGQDLRGYDMFLRQSVTVRVRGRAVDDCTGKLAAGAAIDVVQVDDDGAMIPANAEVQQTSTGEFLIRGLTPGAYELRSSLDAGPKPCPGRSMRERIVVATEAIDGLVPHLALNSVAYFELVRDGKPLGEKLDIRLEPRAMESGIVSVQQGLAPARRVFGEASLRANEEYNIFVSTLMSDDDYHSGPYTVKGGDRVVLAMRSNGARATGTVTDTGKNPVPGSVVTFIPDSYTPQLVREGYSDQSGTYTVTGLAPGGYTAIAWLDVPPCDFLNPAAKLECAAVGKHLSVSANDKTQLELQISGGVPN